MSNPSDNPRKLFRSANASEDRRSAGGGNRTRKGLSPEVFETSASTNSATPADNLETRPPHVPCGGVGNSPR
jgi:hypothetical protein